MKQFITLIVLIDVFIYIIGIKELYEVIENNDTVFFF